MDLGELAGKLPWLLGLLAAACLLRAIYRSQRVQTLPGLPPAAERPPVQEPPPEADADIESEDIEDEESEAESEEEDELAEEEDEEEDELPPHGESGAKGLGGVVIGLVVMAISTVILFVLAPLREGDIRNIIYLVGAAFLLIGSGFLRLGLQRLVTARRRRARAMFAPEPWLRDRDWSREGAEPIAEERLLPQLLGVVSLVALVLPRERIRGSRTRFAGSSSSRSRRRVRTSKRSSRCRSTRESERP